MTAVLDDPITKVVLKHYRQVLTTCTPAELDAAAVEAEALPGEVGRLMRHLVDEEIEYRRAAARAPSCATSLCDVCAPELPRSFL